MRSRCGRWLGSCVLAAAVVSMPAACKVARAQPGFGADPFWPYNNQYTPYTAPTGPAEPMAGGNPRFFPREGVRGANDFQRYLDNLQGGSPGRNLTDRAGLGMPYYRSAVNPLYDKRDARQYIPNRRSNESFERAQERVADRYFAYYSTRDPVRRARLLKEYRDARREAQRVTTGRGQGRSRAAADAAMLESELRQADEAVLSRSSVRGRTSERAAPRSDRLGSAPAVPGLDSDRPSGSRTRATTADDVLNRSRAMDRDAGRRSRLGPSPISPRLRRPGADTTTERGSTYSARPGRTRRTTPRDSQTAPSSRDNP